MPTPENRTKKADRRAAETLPEKEKNYRLGLRRRDSDKMEATAYYALLAIIVLVYGGFILGGLITQGNLL
jgi:hypothetical protein